MQNWVVRKLAHAGVPPNVYCVVAHSQYKFSDSAFQQNEDSRTRSTHGVPVDLRDTPEKRFLHDFMITDPKILASIRSQWRVVKRFCESSHVQYLSPCGAYINETPPERFFNLPLILAFSVLDQVLKELIQQGRVPHLNSSDLLGARMKSARSAIAWQNYSYVECGKKERNAIAHEGKLLDREACLAFINAIEIELCAWRVL